MSCCKASHSAPHSLPLHIHRNHVFVPYCTGDAHLGNNTPSYGVHHVGRLNAQAAAFNAAVPSVVARFARAGGAAQPAATF